MASAGALPDLMTLTEGTEIFEMSPEKLKYVNKDFKKVTAKMYDYKCDVKLKVEKETFKAHREILAEASDYFSAMFSHNMQEKEQDVIELLEISPQGFTSMMEYFYHGHVKVDSGNIEDIIEAARFFHIEWLVRVCCHFLIKHLCLENYDTVLDLEDKYYLGDLHGEVFKFISMNFITLSEQGRFNRLQFELFSQLLSGNCFIDTSEAFILDTVWAWITHDPENREKHQVAMLSLVRFKLLEIEELERIPEGILAIPEIKELVDQAWDYHSLPTKQCLMQTDMTHVRGANDSLVLFSALDDLMQIQYKIPGVFGYFSEETGSDFMESLFEFANAAVLGNFLFVSGGYSRRRMCSSPAFFIYNPRNRSWAQLSSMRQARLSHVLCAASRGLYAVAGIEHLITDEGMDREVILNSGEFYDPEENEWNMIPPMPYGCFNPAATVVDDKLYVSGGISDNVEDNVPVNYLNVYVSGDKDWLARTPMLVDRQGHGMIGHSNKLYVFGGYTVGLDTMSFSSATSTEAYDIETNQWTRMVDLPAEYDHYHSSLATMDDTIYILGGKGVVRTLHSYDTKKEEFGPVEVCGNYVQKLVVLKAAFPPEMM